MEHRTKRDLKLIHLVSEFEAMSATGDVAYYDERTLYQLINYYEDEYLIDKAIEVVEIALSQFKYRAEFYIIKAKLLLRDHQVEEAYQVIEFAESISPFENEISILKARILGAKGESDKAFEILSKIKAYANPSDLVDIYICESYIQENARNYKAMFEILTKALKSDPENQEALERIWISVELSKSYQESVDFHLELIDHKPFNFLAWYNLGHAYSCLGEYEKAIGAMEYSFIINKNFDIAYFECADICCQIQDYQKALSIYEDANQIFGPDHELLVNIAECHLQLDNLLSAKANLFTALRLDPYNDEVYYLLGECYAKEKSLHSAIGAYKKAINIEDAREEYFEGIANAYVQLGDYPNASRYYRKATDIAPEQELLWYKYISILIKENKVKEALSSLDEAEEFAVGAELLYGRAVCLSLLGRKKEALLILDEALVDDFEMHSKLFELDPSLKFDKDILSIINYYEGEPKT